MSRRAEIICVVAVVGCLAAFAGVIAVRAGQESSIRLPPDNAVSQLKAGEGEEAARKNCGICHSTDYLVLQPRFDASRWDAEVRKMMTVYGARISDADVKAIADYLARTYGSASSGRQ